jgi:hypothetical protein
MRVDVALKDCSDLSALLSASWMLSSHETGGVAAIVEKANAQSRKSKSRLSSIRHDVRHARIAPVQNWARAVDVVPLAHAVQLPCPAYFWYVPAAQSAHADWPPALAVPAAHGTRS